jgi:hypothetical protein
VGSPVYNGVQVNNTVRELYGTWKSVRPGDHIVFSVWMKSGPSGGQDPSLSKNYVAACLGWDWYGANGRIGGNIAYDGREYIPYGIEWGQDWVQRKYDLIVPALVDGGDGVMREPNGLILWFGADRHDSGTLWFANSEFYVNPTSTVVGGETEIMVSKTFSGKLSAVDAGAKISGVTVKIAVTGGVTDNLTATTDTQGNYTVTKDYPVTATVSASATAQVDADSTSAAASSAAQAFQIVFTLLKRALTLIVS